MTFAEMKKAVGRRASDPNATRYSTAIEDYIVEAISNLLLSENLIEEQVQPLITEIERNIGFDTGIGKIAINNTNFPDILRVVKPFFNPVSTNPRTLVEDTLEKFNYRKENTVLQPEGNEGFWAKDGNFIRFYFDEIVSGLSTPIMFKVINNPNATDLSASRDLNEDGYGNQFLYQAIELASTNLRRQIGME